MKKVSFLICILTVLITLSSCKKKSNEKAILEFRFSSPDVEATIDERLKSVEATVPYGTDVTDLEPIIVVSDEATISPNSGESMDFTNPVTYTVTAEDGSLAEYVVVVNVESAEKAIIGTWGVEKIEYYNIDYAGNPIAASMTTYAYDPNNISDGIQLVFREDNTGEKRDSSVDTLWIYDDFIVCPDTTTVTTYVYSFDAEASILYLSMEYGRTFALQIVEQNADAFVYEVEYETNYVEKAYLRRLSHEPEKSYAAHFVKQDRPYREGPFLRRR